jgi:hypothetical protein
VSNQGYANTLAISSTDHRYSFFALLTYHSLRVNRQSQKATGRYFWWGTIRLDSDPLNRQPERSTPCKEGSDCVGWDEVDYKWVEPRLAKPDVDAIRVPGILGWSNHRREFEATWNQ